jgi:hypothetical protein
MDMVVYEGSGHGRINKAIRYYNVIVCGEYFDKHTFTIRNERPDIGEDIHNVFLVVLLNVKKEMES